MPNFAPSIVCVLMSYLWKYSINMKSVFLPVLCQMKIWKTNLHLEIEHSVNSWFENKWQSNHLKMETVLRQKVQTVNVKDMNGCPSNQQATLKTLVWLKNDQIHETKEDQERSLTTNISNW